MARRMPISRVRSRTVASMMFMMPMPPTSREMPAMQIMTMLKMAWAWSRWRIWWIYRRRWPAICALHGLTASLTGRTLVPPLRSVTIGTTCDIAVVQILVGQSVANWQSKGLALAEALRAQRVTIRSRRPGEIAITVHRRDVLADPIRLQRLSRGSDVDFSRVDVGVTESGKRWRLPVLGHHIL